MRSFTKPKGETMPRQARLALVLTLQDFLSAFRPGGLRRSEASSCFGAECVAQAVSKLLAVN